MTRPIIRCLPDAKPRSSSLVFSSQLMPAGFLGRRASNENNHSSITGPLLRAFYCRLLKSAPHADISELTDVSQRRCQRALPDSARQLAVAHVSALFLNVSRC